MWVMRMCIFGIGGALRRARVIGGDGSGAGRAEPISIAYEAERGGRGQSLTKLAINICRLFLEFYDPYFGRSVGAI